MTRSLPGFALLACLLALPGLTACAPAVLTSQASALFNHPASKTSDGTILSMRQVAAPAQPAGGTGGAMNAMTAGSSGATGGGWSSMMTGGLSGMLPGGLGGSSMSNLSNITGTAPPAKPASTAANHGQATEFTLRMDDGSTQTVVLGDAQGLHTGDRVEIVRGDKTSLVHVS